jgi:hypothetical protein
LVITGQTAMVSAPGKPGCAMPQDIGAAGPFACLTGAAIVLSPDRHSEMIHRDA